MRFWITVALALAVTACASDGPSLPTQVARSSVGSLPKGERAQAWRTLFGEATIAAWDRIHGPQMEYHAADGRSYLWHPGNRRIVVGDWEIRDGGRHPQLCYRYGANTFNPATGQSGGDWECGDARWRMDIPDDLFAGDTFGLRDGTPPFVSSRTQNPVEFAGAIARIGIVPQRLLPASQPIWVAGEVQR